MSNKNKFLDYDIVIFTAFLMVGSLLMAVYIFFTRPLSLTTKQFSCNHLSADSFIPKRAGAILYVYKDEDLANTKIPNIRYSDFMKDPTFDRIEVAAILKKITPPATIISYVNHKYGTYQLVIIDGINAFASHYNKPVLLCGVLDQVARSTVRNLDA